MPETEQQYTVEQFKNALKKQDDAFVIETTRRQANAFVKNGNPYIAEMLRDLCDRLEKVLPVIELGGWEKTAVKLPEEDRLVQVPNNKGDTHLVRRGTLWFLGDTHVYVYYTPTYWRYL